MIRILAMKIKKKLRKMLQILKKSLIAFAVVSSGVSAYAYDVLDPNSPSCKEFVTVKANNNGGTMITVPAEDMAYAYSFIDKDDHIVLGRIDLAKKDNDSTFVWYADTRDFKIDETYTFAMKINGEQCHSFFSVVRGLFDEADDDNSKTNESSEIKSVYATQFQTRVIFNKLVNGNVNIKVVSTASGMVEGEYNVFASNQKELVFNNKIALSNDINYIIIVEINNQMMYYKFKSNRID